MTDKEAREKLFKESALRRKAKLIGKPIEDKLHTVSKKEKKIAEEKLMMMDKEDDNDEIMHEEDDY